MAVGMVFMGVITVMVLDSMGVGDSQDTILPLMIPEHIKMETRHVFGMDTIGDVTNNESIFNFYRLSQIQGGERETQKINVHHQWAVCFKNYRPNKILQTSVKEKFEAKDRVDCPVRIDSIIIGG